jgi:hypothetical protein
MQANDKRVTDALTTLRTPVREILEDGDDPAEVLAFGTLVRRYAEKDTDLVLLRTHLEHSSLPEVVGDVAFATDDSDDDFDEDELDEDEPGALGEDEDDLLGEN